MTLVQSVPIDHEAILKSLNLNPRDPNVQALFLVCERYDLDPILKHAVLIKGNLYVTRDGLLHVAHRAGTLDGIVVEDEGETDSHWWAKVTVYVKGQGHGYTYRGRYPKQGGGNKAYGPEMAVKCAEVMALRRAYGVTGVGTLEERWDEEAARAEATASEPSAPPRPPLPHEIEAAKDEPAKAMSDAQQKRMFAIATQVWNPDGSAKNHAESQRKALIRWASGGATDASGGLDRDGVKRLMDALTALEEGRATFAGGELTERVSDVVIVDAEIVQDKDAGNGNRSPAGSTSRSGGGGVHADADAVSGSDRDAARPPSPESDTDLATLIAAVKGYSDSKVNAFIGKWCRDNDARPANWQELDPGHPAYIPVVDWLVGLREAQEGT